MSDQVETRLGTTVVETPRRVHNPVTERTEDLSKLSEDGYCRRFLALLSHTDGCHTVDFSSTPVATFDKDKWGLEERDNQFVLTKKEAESEFGKMLLEGDE